MKLSMKCWWVCSLFDGGGLLLLLLLLLLRETEFIESLLRIVRLPVRKEPSSKKRELWLLTYKGGEI